MRGSSAREGFLLRNSSFPSFLLVDAPEPLPQSHDTYRARLATIRGTAEKNKLKIGKLEDKKANELNVIPTLDSYSLYDRQRPPVRITKLNGLCAESSLKFKQQSSRYITSMS